jgi:hypothetical protein
LNCQPRAASSLEPKTLRGKNARKAKLSIGYFFPIESFIPDGSSFNKWFVLQE